MLPRRRSAVCFLFGLFCLFQRQGHNLSLAFRSVKIGIHQTQSGIRHRLHSVQMIHSRALQLVGTDPSGINRLSDKTVYVRKFRISNLDVHTTQNIDSLRYSLPVKGSVIVNL